MTVLAAAMDTEGAVWIASDSLHTVGNMALYGDGHKWLLNPERTWALGASGSVTPEAVLHRNLSRLWPKEPGRAGALELLDNVRAIFGDEGAQPPREDDGTMIWPEYRFSPLIATTTGGGGLWRAASCLRDLIDAYEGRWLTAGSGEDIAAGVLSELWGDDIPEQVVRRAITAACRLRVDCGGREHVVRLDHPQVGLEEAAAPVRRVAAG